MKKQKLDRKNYMFDTRKGEVLIKTPGQIDGKDFVVMNCEDCEIYVCDWTSQVFVDDCINCKIYFGPCEGSLFVRECKGIQISCAASQFRVSDSTDITAYVYAASDPALEKVTNIQLAPYNFSYAHVDEHFAKAKLNINENKWSEVFDFTPNLALKNWSLMSPTDYPGAVVKSIEGFPEAPPNPVPIPLAYGGTSTKAIREGSLDAQECEKGSLAKLMSKQNVTAIMEQEGDVEISHSVPLQTQNDWFEETTAQPTQQDTAPQSTIKDYSSLQSSSSPLPKAYTAESQQKDDLERIEKQKKQEQASLWLQQWRSAKELKIKETKANNRASQELQKINRSQMKQSNGWSMVASNIALKDGDLEGKKSITQMRQAILNKRADLQQSRI